MSVPEEFEPVTVSWAAEKTGTSNDTIRRMISRGELHGYRVGRSIRLNKTDVLNLIQPIPTVANTARGDRFLGMR